MLTVAGEYSSTYEDGLLVAMKKHLHERGLDYEGLEADELERLGYEPPETEPAEIAEGRNEYGNDL